MITLRQQPPLRASFRQRVLSVSNQPLTAQGIMTLQVNVGYRCNLSCSHCHVEAGPERREIMDSATIDAVLDTLARYPIATLDITGGAPELNPQFRRLVSAARKLGKRIIVRTNLAVLHEPGMEDLPVLYRAQEVELIASLPCYQQDNVDRMRGSGTFSRCIDSLRRLNSLGYGSQADHPLHLVYNPAGPFLPPHQAALEQDYRRVLRDTYGISFTSLYAITNMPVGRFRDRLVRSNDLDKYHDLLSGSFNPATLEGVMCRTLVSVGWDGRLYDCDFNQILGMTVEPAASGHIRSFSYESLASRTIQVGDHCYGCTAGHGSTCTGATA
ncbi:MAG: arsenosugar biosynthesis radical SAM protein ArsS [Nitrospirota bacterium]|nr:arsenosugar biosynthesis radical SAM protein ArsS [Nitrospirota bacterium]